MAGAVKDIIMQMIQIRSEVDHVYNQGDDSANALDTFTHKARLDSMIRSQFL